jgi:hypothetical protein
MVETERLALWAVDYRYIGQHIHRQVVYDLRRILRVQRLFRPVGKSLEVDPVEFGELYIVSYANSEGSIAQS